MIRKIHAVSAALLFLCVPTLAAPDRWRPTVGGLAPGRPRPRRRHSSNRASTSANPDESPGTAQHIGHAAAMLRDAEFTLAKLLTRMKQA